MDFVDLFALMSGLIVLGLASGRYTTRLVWLAWIAVLVLVCSAFLSNFPKIGLIRNWAKILPFGIAFLTPAAALACYVNPNTNARALSLLYLLLGIYIVWPGLYFSARAKASPIE